MRFRASTFPGVFCIALALFAHTASAQTFVASKVVRFEQLAGQPAWKNAALERLRTAEWTFGPNGKFSYYVPESATGTLQGTYTVKGKKVEFRASGGYQMGYTGGAQSIIVGTVDFSQNPPVLTMVQRTGSMTAASVNGTQFGASNGSSYLSVATLVKRRR